jgi:hypothetical protein
MVVDRLITAPTGLSGQRAGPETKIEPTMKPVTTALLGAITATVVLCGSQASQAATIDYEDLAIAPGTQTSEGDITSGGYFFDSNINSLKRVNAVTDYADSGSTYLQIRSLGGPANVVTMSPSGGGTFRLNSIQYGEGFKAGAGSAGLLVTGNLFGGGTVSTTLNFDGINDGPGGLADFQLATFDATWVNLTSVVFAPVPGLNDNRMGIDNIVVNVPEPSSLALIGMGILACALRRFAHKS